MTCQSFSWAKMSIISYERGCRWRACYRILLSYSIWQFFGVQKVQLQFFGVLLFKLQFFVVQLFILQFFGVKLFGFQFFRVILFGLQLFWVQLFGLQFFTSQIIWTLSFGVRFFYSNFYSNFFFYPNLGTPILDQNLVGHIIWLDNCMVHCMVGLLVRYAWGIIL